MKKERIESNTVMPEKYQQLLNAMTEEGAKTNLARWRELRGIKRPRWYQKD